MKGSIEGDDPTTLVGNLADIERGRLPFLGTVSQPLTNVMRKTKRCRNEAQAQREGIDE